MFIMQLFLMHSLLLIQEEEEQMQQQRRGQNYIHSRYKKRFLKSLSIAQRRIRYNRIPRTALLSPAESAWRKIHRSENDQAMVTLTGFDYATFEELNTKFQPLFDGYTPFSRNETHIVPMRGYRQGRPRSCTSRDCLALNLAWTRTRGGTKILSIIFGITQSPLERYLLFGRRILLEVLNADPDARVKIPTDHMINQFKFAIQNRHPLLTDVWCAMDGLKLSLECARDPEYENDFYNGWTCDHYVSSVFVFCPDGSIAVCAYNVPGSVHDSKIAVLGGIYNKLDKVFRDNGGKCCVDSAFAAQENPALIKSGKNDVVNDPILREIKKQATSLRQTSEWGMHGFESSFPRVKDRFKMEYNGERKRIIQLIIYLYNYRSRKVGINQIRNVYMPYLQNEAADMSEF
jgi:hypothetical protein